MAYKRKSKKTAAQKAERKSMGKIAHKNTTIDGIKFDSKMESDYYLYLKEEKKAGRVKSFEMQPEFILQPKYFILDGIKYTYEEGLEDIYKDADKDRKKHNKANPDNKINIIQAIKYRADFDVIYANGSRRIIDPKGIKTADFKLKEKMFNFKFPELPLDCVIWNNKEKKWDDFDAYHKSKKGKNNNGGKQN